jgi:nicotinamide-nucleotide amidase
MTDETPADPSGAEGGAYTGRVLWDLDGLAPLLIPLADAARTRAWRVTTAESCTGGLIAAACTALAGSSDWYDRGFVTYSNAAKTAQLGVTAELLAAHGAVSDEVARAMALGALARADAHLTVAVTGVAGPGGGSIEKPVGLVWMALAWRTGGSLQDGPTEVVSFRDVHPGSRAAVRSATLRLALQRLAAAAQGASP